jgi:hypothetical protein
MVDFTTVKAQVNTGTSDASPTFTDLLFGTANYELRLCGTGVGNGTTASASWFTYVRPASTGTIPEMWGYFGSDASGGLKVSTYDGTGAHYKQFLVSWDNLGTFASAPLVSAWKDNTLPAASPGTQPGTGDGSAFVNGQTTDTSNTSYIKATMYGFGVTAGGSQQTPGSNSGVTFSATTGSAGAVTTASAAWCSGQSLQAATQWIANGATPAATTAGLWYGVLSFWTGPNMTGGTLVPVIGFQYTWV